MCGLQGSWPRPTLALSSSAAAMAVRLLPFSHSLRYHALPTHSRAYLMGPLPTASRMPRRFGDCVLIQSTSKTLQNPGFSVFFLPRPHTGESGGLGLCLVPATPARVAPHLRRLQTPPWPLPLSPRPLLGSSVPPCPFGLPIPSASPARRRGARAKGREGSVEGLLGTAVWCV